MSRPHPVRIALWRSLALLGTAGLILAGATTATAKSHKPPKPPKPPAVKGLEGLKILLTNDDSMQAARPTNSDGLGLYEIRKALCAAGADVVTIAPWAVQSGRGTAVTNSGTFALGKKDPMPAEYAGDCLDAPSKGALFGLCLDAVCGPTSLSATPSDTVKFASRGGLYHVAGWEGEPDLVVSGINSGANVANSVTDSGTVGAAVAAIEDDIPAVAFSTNGLSDFSAFPVANYRATAEYGARLLSALRAKKLLLQHKFALNVNYPNISEGKAAKKAVWTSISDGMFAYHYYTKKDDGSFTVGLKVCEGLALCEVTRKDADKVWVNDKNHISISPINWDRTYGHSIDGKRELAKVRDFVKNHAPKP